ncbi:energy transducer TonB [Sphingomonas sp. LY29]|uniref:energy transducer TonB n=1 Tax=Sphingomonas sp. LY29 TaxID=3095341 RepID=UPI002D799538|nr:energy transducer TonB [Sphingomonas sp. LY29]WRP26537.1 energy transducer TonB [Sphingomonas sp. LY29]
MSIYRAQPSRSDRAKAIAAVVAVHAALGALLAIRGTTPAAPVRPPPTVLIDIAVPPPPPPVQSDPGRAREEEGAAGKKAEPSPIVAPDPPIRLPTPPPVPAAPIAGTGLAATAGAASAGTGPGAGGSGTGRGAGGNGSGGGIGSEARLLSGGLTRADYRSLRGQAFSPGRARLALQIGEDGRVVRCSIANSSGNPDVDSALCDILEPRMRWAPARDMAGNPISVGLYYVATWQRF